MRFFSISFALAMLFGGVAAASAASPPNWATQYPAQASSGYSAYRFTHGIGANVHWSYTNAGQWGNYPFVSQLLVNMGFHMFRGSINTDAIPGTNNAYAKFVNSLCAQGLKGEFISGNSTTFNSNSFVASQLAYLQPGCVFGLEGPNELDNGGDASWATHDQQSIANLNYPGAKQFGAGGVSVLSPSLLGFNFTHPQQLTLDNYVDFTNMHEYSSGWTPENAGFGGVHFGYVYGTVAYNKAFAQQTTLLSPKPVIATETGFANQPDFGDGIYQGITGNMDQYSAGVYGERNVLYNYMNGVPQTYIYDLVDEETGDNTDHYWGFARANGTLRYGAYGMQGLLKILDDTADQGEPCSLPWTVSGPTPNPSPVYPNTGVQYESAGFCKSDGSYALALWTPTQVYNPTTHAPQYPTTPVNVTVALTPGYTPSSVVQWSQNAQLHWASQSIGTGPLASVSINDRPTILVFNPTQPVVLPPLPTPPPTPAPTGLQVNQIAPQIAAQYASANTTTSSGTLQQEVSPQVGDLLITALTADQTNTTTQFPAPIPNKALSLVPMTRFPSYDTAPYYNSSGQQIVYRTVESSTLRAVSWPISGQNWFSLVQEDITGGVNSAQPIGAYASSTNTNGTVVCPSVTVPQAGDLVLAFVSMKHGGDNSLVPYPTSLTSGWTIDGYPIPTYDASIALRDMTLTTTANQTVSGPTFVFAASGYVPWYCTTVAIQHQ